MSYPGLRAKDKSFNADFKTDLDESIGRINVIGQDISRVLLNLFNNAFYAVNERQKVEGLKQNANYKPLVFLQTRKYKTRRNYRVSTKEGVKGTDYRLN